MTDEKKIPLVKAAVEIPPREVKMEGANGATIRKIFTEKEGAPTFAMRLFELEPGGYTPLHTHPHEHEVFVVEGKAEMTTEEGPVNLKAGDAILVYPNALHNFKNTGNTPMRFLCFIPLGI
jgi:quercetin dioxygenase-like cupin family protein